MKLVLATGNKNKIREIRNKFSGLPGIELLPMHEAGHIPEVEEDADSFEGNAMKKAKEIFRATGLPALADDSGLVVDGLGGRPGVYSARYGGADKNDRERCELLLEEMKDMPEKERTARFVCVIAVVFPDGRSASVRGECEGTIAGTMTGAGGFGYDPVFFLPEYGKTMAELTIEEKNLISHRAKALEKARALLEKETA